MYKKLLLFIILIYSFSFSQNKEYLIAFDNSVGFENLPFHNGVFHVDVYKHSLATEKGLYFLSNIESGSIVFENQFYPNLNLRYDVYSDQLVYYETKNATNGGIILEKTKIKEFFINDFHFINNETLGYLQINQIFKDNNKLLTKHIKSKSDRIRFNSVVYFFKDKFNFYFEKNGKLFLLRNQKSILNLYSNKKKEISNFYKKNKLLFKKNPTDFYKNLFLTIYEN